MRIALLTQYYKPEMGAPQNRLYEMVTGLKSLGNEIIVITGMPNYPTGKIFSNYTGKFFCTENTDGIKIKRYWLYASNSKKKISRIWNMLSFSITSLFSTVFLRKNKIDYLIVESPPLTLGITAWLISKATGVRLIANISDLWPLSARELGAISGESALYGILEKVERFIYKKSVLCIGQSSEIVEYIREHGAKDVYLFRNGVDPKRFETIERTKTDDKFTIVYAGLLGFAQGILDICKNVDFEALGVAFHIYGAGGEQKEIESYISENPDKGITYFGKVSREEIPAILKNADATLVPLVKNIYGAVPSKIYESMAAGIPILFSGEGEGRKIIQENNLGLVSSSGDYEKIKKNIKELVKDPVKVQFIKDNCMYCANEKFNRPKQISDLNKYLLSK